MYWKCCLWRKFILMFESWERLEIYPKWSFSSFMKNNVWDLSDILHEVWYFAMIFQRKIFFCLFSIERGANWLKIRWLHMGKSHKAQLFQEKSMFSAISFVWKLSKVKLFMGFYSGKLLAQENLMLKLTVKNTLGWWNLSIL